MEINKELAKDIIARFECESTDCEDCRLHGRGCDAYTEYLTLTLQALLKGAEQNANVSQENAANNEALPAEPGQASKYITIPVAEYHFLTKAATLLEIILADRSYSPNTVVAAVRTVVQEMVQQTEAGAAQ